MSLHTDYEAACDKTASDSQAYESYKGYVIWTGYSMYNDEWGYMIYAPHRLPAIKTQEGYLARASALIGAKRWIDEHGILA